MLWLGLLFPLTGWPAAFLARRAGVRLSLGYWLMQGFPAVTLLVMGGLPCL